MKIVIKIILLTGVLAYFVFAISSLSRDEDQRICSGVEILLKDSTNNDYVNTRFIKDLLEQAKTPIKGVALKNINIKNIEDHLKKSPYIDSVICYYTPDNLMCIRISTRMPVIHVMPENGESYYMDINGNTMPTNVFLLDVCLATGNISKKYAKEKLLDLATFINNRTPWDKEIQQIHVRNEKHIELITLTGDHTIILGEPIDIADKMERLSVFYKEGLDKAGWNKYRTINLNYADQVVCTKRNKK
mgnify:FL=1